jgi:hypothetical protein
MFPASLVSCIAQQHQRFNDLKPAHQSAIAQMLWDCSLPGRRHVSHSTSTALPKARIRQIWGSDSTMRQVIGKEYFSVIAGDNIVGKANAFTPKDYMQDALWQCLLDESVTSFISAKGDDFHFPKRAISSRTSADKDTGAVKKSAWAEVNCSAALMLDRSSLTALLHSTTSAVEALAAARLLRMSRNPLRPGFVPLLYQQVSTGRIFESMSQMQRVPRRVRNAALAGCWDYDISNCHFSILQQYASKQGLGSPVTDRYLRGKREIRAQLALATGASETQIKTCLLALVYGASLNPNPDFSDIGKALGRGVAQLFCKDPFVMALRLEISAIGKAVVDSMPRHRGLYGNAMGVYKAAPKVRAAAALLSHALQGVEAAALRAVLRQFGGIVELCMHDGWVTRQRVPVQEFADAISIETGFQLSVEEVRLEPTPESDVASVHATTPSEFRKLFSDQQVTDDDGWSCASNSIREGGGFWVSASPSWNRSRGIGPR